MSEKILHCGKCLENIIDTWAEVSAYKIFFEKRPELLKMAYEDPEVFVGLMKKEREG